MATNLTLYLSIDLSGFNFLLKIYLFPIGLLPWGKFANSQAWFLRMNSISLFTASFYICTSRVDIALYVWGSLSSVYAMKFRWKNLEILDLVLLLSSAFALTSSLKTISCAFSPEVLSSSHLDERCLQKIRHLWIW